MPESDPTKAKKRQIPVGKPEVISGAGATPLISLTFDNLTDYKKTKPEIIIIPDQEFYEFVNERVFKVVNYVREKYGDKYNTPGIRYQEYLLNNPNKVPYELKEGKNYLLALA